MAGADRGDEHVAPVTLGPRLEAVLDLLRPCERLADVGCDHALIALGAVDRGIAARAWGVDLNAAPLAAAAPAVAAYGRGRVALVRGDGLAPLADVRPDAVVLAGMGAATMVRILGAARDVAQIVAQPNTEAYALRAWARASGWAIDAEGLVRQRGQFFTTLRLVPGAPAAVEGFSADELDRLGPLLLRQGGAAYEAWLAAQERRLAKYGDASTFARALAFVRGEWVP